MPHSLERLMILRLFSLALLVFLLFSPCLADSLSGGNTDVLPQSSSQQIEIEKPVSGQLAQEQQLALNDLDTHQQPAVEKKLSSSNPVILVPMVLAALALVAVSRRKERNSNKFSE